MRSSIAAATELGVVVRIEHVSTVLPLASLRRSHNPGKANNSHSSTSKQYGCLDFPVRDHSQKLSAGIMHLRNFSASRNAGLEPAVSDLALIIRAAADGSFAHDGISPQRTSDNFRTGSLGCWRMTATGWVGAMLYRTLQSGSSETLSKCSSMSCFRHNAKVLDCRRASNV